jgi:hypothetical protein
MEFLKRERLLENYTIRDVQKGLLKDNGHHGTSADTTNYTFYKYNLNTTYDNGEYTTTSDIIVDNNSDGILYGKVLDIKTDGMGNPLKDNNSTYLNNLIPNTIDVDIELVQSFDDMGIFTDMDFIGIGGGTKPADFNPFTNGRLPGLSDTDYELDGITVTGETDDRKLLTVQSYVFDINGDPIYKKDLNMAQDLHNTFDGVTNTPSANGVDEILYVIGGEADHTDGDGNDFYVNGTGILFRTKKTEYSDKTYKNGKVDRWKKTTFSHTDGGRKTETNMSLSAIFKQEEFSGVVFPPEVEDNVFIIRGGDDIFERNAIMAEIKTSNDIDEYRDGYLKG